MSFWDHPLESVKSTFSDAKQWVVEDSKQWVIDKAVAFKDGAVAAGKIVVNDPGRAATLAWDGLQDGVASGVGFVGGVIAGGAAGAVGVVADAGNLALRGITLDNYGRKDGSFTWDLAKGGYKGTYGAIHWLGKDVLFDNVLDRGINLGADVAGLPTMERVPVASAPGEGFIHGTGSFVGGIAGTAGAMKLVKWGGSALMAAYNGASGAGAAGAAQALSTGQKLSSLQARTILNNAHIPLAEKVSMFGQAGRADLAERAVHLAMAEGGAQSLPMTMLRSSPYLSESFLSRAAAAQVNSAGSTFGISRIAETASSRFSYAAQYPGHTVLQIGSGAARLAGKTALAAVKNPVVTAGAVATAATVSPAVRDAVTGALSGAADTVLDKTGLKKPLQELGISKLFYDAADKMHENPLLWGSLIGVGTYLLGATATSFIPQAGRFSDLIGLAIAAAVVYALYQKGNERAAGKENASAHNRGFSAAASGERQDTGQMPEKDRRVSVAAHEPMRMAA